MVSDNPILIPKKCAHSKNLDTLRSSPRRGPVGASLCRRPPAAGQRSPSWPGREEARPWPSQQRPSLPRWPA